MPNEKNTESLLSKWFGKKSYAAFILLNSAVLLRSRNPTFLISVRTYRVWLATIVDAAKQSLLESGDRRKCRSTENFIADMEIVLREVNINLIMFSPVDSNDLQLDVDRLYALLEYYDI